MVRELTCGRALEVANFRFYLQDLDAKKWTENFMTYVNVRDAHAWHKHARP